MENEMHGRTARISRLHAIMETECKEYSRRLQLKHNSFHFHWREMVFLSCAVVVFFCLHLSVHFHRRRHCGIWSMGVPRCHSMLAWISYGTWAKRIYICLCLQCGRNNFEFHCYTYACGERMYCGTVCTPFSTAYELPCTRHVFHMNCSCTTENKSPKLPHTLQVELFGPKSNLLVRLGIHEVTKAFTQSGASNELCRKPQCAGEIMSRPIWKRCLSSSALCTILSPKFAFSMNWRRPKGD